MKLPAELSLLRFLLKFTPYHRDSFMQREIALPRAEIETSNSNFLELAFRRYSFN